MGRENSEGEKLGGVRGRVHEIDERRKEERRGEERRGEERRGEESRVDMGSEREKTQAALLTTHDAQVRPILA